MRRAIVQIQNTNGHTPRTMRGAIPSAQNLRFATVSHDRPAESYERVHPAKSKCASRYSGVPSKISKCTFRYSGTYERMASAVARGMQKSSIYHSFGRATSTKWRKGCPSTWKIRVSPQFWTSDEHEVMKGLRERPANMHFTTVLDVRRARSEKRAASATWKICISPQFWASDEREVTRGLLRQREKFAFHHSFGRPTSTKWREGCFGNVKNLHFTTVLGVRQARSEERVASAT